MRCKFAAFLLIVLLITGCSEAPSDDSSPPVTTPVPVTITKAEVPPPPPPPPPAEVKPAVKKAETSVASSTPQADVPPSVQPPGSYSAPVHGSEESKFAPPGSYLKVNGQEVHVGVGVKGQGYGNDLITQPVAVYFQTRERIIFTIQIPHAMQLYEQMEGHRPKSQEEFINEILKPSQISLPPLPGGLLYYYDPEKGELMVGQFMSTHD